jgi:hypothetical protein
MARKHWGEHPASLSGNRNLRIDARSAARRVVPSHPALHTFPQLPCESPPVEPVTRHTSQLLLPWLHLNRRQSVGHARQFRAAALPLALVHRRQSS